MLFIFWVYLIMAILGVAVLIVMAFVGDIFHMGGPDIDVGADVGAAGPDFESGGGPSPLGLPLLLVAVTMIGVIGSVLTYLGIKWYLTIVIAVGGSLIVSFVAYLVFSKMFKQMSSDAHEDIRRFKGRTGNVTIRIPKGKEGQVVFSSDKSGRFTVGATSDQDIPIDTVVVVTDIQGDIVEVRPRARSKSNKNESEVKVKDGKKQNKKKGAKK